MKSKQMNTNFHYNGLDFFQQTQSYDEQREAYKKELIAGFAENNQEGRSSRLYRFRRFLVIGYKMSVYRMRLMF